MPTKKIQDNAKIKMEKTKDVLRADLMAIRILKLSLSFKLDYFSMISIPVVFFIT